jgi:outer membrane protein
MTMASKKLLGAAGMGLAVLAWWLAPPASGQGPQASRVGFVDARQVLARSVAGVAARERLEKEKATMQKQVDSIQAEITRMREDLEKKGQLLSAEARKDKQEALERKIRDVRRLVDDLQKELQKKEREVIVQIEQDIGSVVERVGKEKGYTLIVERRGAGVMYGATEADLTGEVIRVYDEETKKAKK